MEAPPPVGAEAEAGGEDEAEKPAPEGDAGRDSVPSSPPPAAAFVTAAAAAAAASPNRDTPIAKRAKPSRDCPAGLVAVAEGAGEAEVNAESDSDSADVIVDSD